MIWQSVSFLGKVMHSHILLHACCNETIKPSQIYLIIWLLPLNCSLFYCVSPCFVFVTKFTFVFDTDISTHLPNCYICMFIYSISYISLFLLYLSVLAITANSKNIVTISTIMMIVTKMILVIKTQFMLQKKKEVYRKCYNYKGRIFIKNICIMQSYR